MNIAFIDLQNTLTADDLTLSKQTLNDFKKIEVNYKIVLSSSAYPSEIKTFLKKYNLDWDFIAASGAVSSLGDNLNFKIKPTILKEAKEDILFFFYEKNDIVYIYNYMERIKNLYPKNDKQEFIDLDNFNNDTYNQLYICLKTPYFLKVKDNFKALGINSQVIINDSTITLVRLKPILANKGYFVKKFLEYYQIDFNKSICFGDSVDDIDLFKEVNIKVAVENAIPELKEMADYVVKNALENGVADFLLTFDDPSTL